MEDATTCISSPVGSVEEVVTEAFVVVGRVVGGSIVGFIVVTAEG